MVKHLSILITETFLVRLTWVAIFLMASLTAYGFWRVITLLFS